MKTSNEDFYPRSRTNFHSCAVESIISMVSVPLLMRFFHWVSNNERVGLIGLLEDILEDEMKLLFLSAAHDSRIKENEKSFS